MLWTVGEAVEQARARSVLDLPNAMGSDDVSRDNLGRLVILVLCVTDGVAVEANAIILMAVAGDARPVMDFQLG